MKHILPLMMLGLMVGAADAATLKSAVITTDAELTLGEIFDGAGTAASIVVSQIHAPGGQIVLDAARLQGFAAQNGLTWSNSMGMRRVIATRSTIATRTVSLDDYTAPGFGGAPDGIKSTHRNVPVAPIAVKKGDVLRVVYAADGIMLTVKGRAAEDGQLGQTIRITNVDSNRTIDARITGSGQAMVETFAATPISTAALTQ